MTTKQILTSYQKAAKALHEARNALQEIGCNHNNWSSEDAKYYSHQIAELLSCDDGQAGIEALIRRLDQMTGHS
jgi:hypothetical protein